MSNLHINEQNNYRHAVAKTIKDIGKNNKVNNKKSKEEWKQIMNIKNKIDTNKLIITRAEKGKTLIILTHEEYKHKIQNFIQDNHLMKLNKYPTQQYQKIVKQTLKLCSDIEVGTST
jgi:predicted nucleotide-binding protein (sugar kinase/HSP70/actin superfamily)